VRVISGKFKGKPLFAPKGNSVRPTTDRVKETLFNILFSYSCLDEALVLDLFAGSGALGIEALSRGATKAIFVDLDNKSIDLVKKNLDKVGAKKEEFRIIHADYKKALSLLVDSGHAQDTQKFDIIFIDPPFKNHNELDIIKDILSSNILATNGIIVIEHEATNKLESLKIATIPLKINTRILGNTSLTFCSDGD